MAWMAAEARLISSYVGVWCSPLKSSEPASNAILFGIIDLIGDIFHGPSRSYQAHASATGTSMTLVFRPRHG
jgi:hypothetical protein